jgi:hypothetical protein
MKKVICILLCGLIALCAHAGYASVAKVKQSAQHTVQMRNAALADL